MNEKKSLSGGRKCFLDLLMILKLFWDKGHIYILARVDMVGTNHDKVLTQWRHMPIFFWYELLPLTSGPQKFSKIGAVKVDYFDFPGEIFEKNLWIRC